MKKQSLNKGDGTFVAIYTCYRRICGGSSDAAILLRILEQRTNSGELTVSWKHSDIINFSKGTLSLYSIKSATKNLLDRKIISIKSGQGKVPEYTLHPDVVNGLISMLKNEPNLVENDEVSEGNLVENDEVPHREQRGSSSKSAKNLVENDEVLRRNQRSLEVENSLQNTENKEAYGEISECPKNNKNVVRMFKEENQEYNTSNGSVITAPLETVAEAPLTSVAYAPSLAIEEENFQEAAIETTSAIITTSASFPGHGDKKMSTADVLTEIFIKYAKIPEKKRDAKCKGSASRLMQNWGDKLKSVVDEVGEEAVVAMDNFIRDEYWLAKGLPLPAFKSQYRKYLSAEEPEPQGQSEIRTESKAPRKAQSATSGYQGNQFAYTDHHPIAVFSLQDQSGATLRKREALDILQHVGGDLEAEGRAAIGFKIDETMYGAIEEWHSKALQAYKSIKHRDYPVLTDPIKGA